MGKLGTKVQGSGQGRREPGGTRGEVVSIQYIDEVDTFRPRSLIAFRLRFRLYFTSLPIHSRSRLLGKLEADPI
jgi:hypothetical protein